MAETVASTHVYDLAMTYLTNGATPVFPTGFRLLDRAIGGGFVKGSIYLIGGRPGEGKSSWSLSIARRMAFDGGAKVVFLSLEMSALELTEWMLAQTSRKPVEELKRLRESRQLEALMRPFVQVCKASKFRIEDARGATLADLNILFDEMTRAEEPTPDVLVIDHLQHQLFTEGLSRAEAMANYLSDLKAFAKRMHLIVLACSQINRESKKDKSLQLHHLKSCVSGKTFVSGFRIKDIVQNKQRLHVACLDVDTGRKHWRKPVRYIRSGLMPCSKLRTATGKTIIISHNTKVFTTKGWKRVDDLSIGDKIVIEDSSDSTNGGSQWHSKKDTSLGIKDSKAGVVTPVAPISRKVMSPGTKVNATHCGQRNKNRRRN